MKRSWFTERDQASQFGEGTEVAQAKALTLAQLADADLIDSLIKAVVGLQTFGGKVFIGAERARFDRNGKQVSHNAPGQYQTTAYVLSFDHEPMKGMPAEPEINYPEAAALYRSQALSADPEANGTPTPVGAVPDGDSD